MTAFVTDNALRSAYDGSTPMQRKNWKRRIEGIYKAEWFACAAHDFNLLHTNMIDKNEGPKISRIQSNLILVKNIHSQKIEIDHINLKNVTIYKFLCAVSQNRLLKKCFLHDFL